MRRTLLLVAAMAAALLMAGSVVQLSGLGRGDPPVAQAQTTTVRLWVGFDVGKTSHWVCVLDEEGEVVLSRREKATERNVEECWSEIELLGGQRTVAVDLLGGPATMLEAILLGHGERVFFLPRMAVNRARDGYRGEQKSDARDAKVIAYPSSG